MRIGYARVSTDDQNLDLQRDALTAAGCTVIYEEKASGSKTNRPELDQMLKALRPGDSVVVWKLCRLGRSLPHLVKTMQQLEDKGVAFESLTEKIDTSSAAGRLVRGFFALLANYELELTKERTHAGLTAARARGRRGGRKPKLTDQDAVEIDILLSSGKMTVSDIAKRKGVSRTTIYNHIKQREQSHAAQ